jgi:hypothetical protein
MGIALSVVANDLSIDIVSHTLIRDFSGSSTLGVPRDIEILGCSCFTWCQSLRAIVIPRRIGVLCSIRFASCSSL